jgi:hypothetical protein
MNIKITPTRFEIEDQHGLLATVKMFDGYSSTIKIKTVNNHTSWPALSAAIQQALEQMHSEVKE